MISELDPMSRRPLAPDLWEQALVNGRIVSPGSDQEALEYAEKWYARQGGLFDEVEPAPPGHVRHFKRGRLQWVGTRRGEPVVLYAEPGTSLGLRLWVAIASWIPGLDQML